MLLRDRPLLYVFLEAHNLAAQRAFMEDRLGLPVIETDDDPSHRHGVVKYDAGSLLLSLNLSPASRFRVSGSDGLTIVCAGGTALVTDPHGHRFRPGGRPPVVTELRLRVTDPAACVPFYRDVLGLWQPEPAEPAFVTGSVPIVLEAAPPVTNGCRVRHDTYLLVFHTPDIDRSTAELADAGLTFSGRGVGSKEIGRTIHFTDPGGHRFCLYQPSELALGYDSGATLREILAGR
ncbi:VOC family protein [Actinoplanes aureus]|uniref:VOC family protein n=1 Tax=Actinoplanes aureus TaxID=2792083 RepID=A0A931G5C3_9ACTN|nr:VOC family protein [Actinoplanes aureus]MBG0566099.1 VOC family protein [Actinoplanes aureus]